MHAIVVHFSTNFIFELSIYYRTSNQNSRTIALKLILEWVVVVGSRRFSLRSNFAGSGNFAVKYVTYVEIYLNSMRVGLMERLSHMWREPRLPEYTSPPVLFS